MSDLDRGVERERERERERDCYTPLTNDMSDLYRGVERERVFIIIGLS